jgi:hypothetical protein
MARFPLKEAEVIALSQAMVSGLTGNAALYPAPPVLPAALTSLVSAYTTAKNAAIAAVATAELDSLLPSLLHKAFTGQL